MKKILIIGMLFLISNVVWAKCIGIERTEYPQKCLKLKIDCPKGTIYTVEYLPVWVHTDKGDYRKEDYVPTCVPCESDKTITIIPNCVSVEEARALCPNRYISYGCGSASVLKCNDYEIVDEKSHICMDPPDMMY